MDSPNPYSQQSNFVDLLNSQQDSHYPSPYPYHSSSQPIEFGSVEVPINAATAEERKERKKWKPEEDIMLISAWLNISKDAVVSNEQNSGAFWARIAALYVASPGAVGGEKREVSKCKEMWRKINEIVQKFYGAYEAAKRQLKSGQNDVDELNLAHQIFASDYKKKFNLEHAWKVLRNEQKWCSNFYSEGGGSSKRRKCEDGSAQTVSSQLVNNGEEDIMARPPGVKASKAKAKMTATKTVQDQTKLINFQNMWDLKEKDLAMKDRLSDKKVLAMLIAKRKPLTDEEIVLKRKLIADMYSP